MLPMPKTTSDRNIDLYKADKKIKTLVKDFEDRLENPGPYYDKSLAAAKYLTFQGIQLHKRDRKDDPPPDFSQCVL
jgi:hypothetical protein